MSSSFKVVPYHEEFTLWVAWCNRISLTCSALDLMHDHVQNLLPSSKLVYMKFLHKPLGPLYCFHVGIFSKNATFGICLWYNFRFALQNRIMGVKWASWCKYMYYVFTLTVMVVQNMYCRYCTSESCSGLGLQLD